MISIFITFVIFLIAFITQLLLVRIFRRLNIHTFVSFAIHIIGFTIVVFLVLPLNELPYTAILAYILLTVLLVTFSFVPLLGGRSPTSVIITALQKRKATISQLLMAFDEKEMILNRVEDLINVGIVKKRGGRYIISRLGLFISWFISTVSSLIGLKML